MAGILRDPDGNLSSMRIIAFGMAIIGAGMFIYGGAVANNAIMERSIALIALVLGIKMGQRFGENKK